ncbi:hypothetical protein AB0E62_00320 [Streptomyces sp. NPDC038707]|uniref:hypothetical protein n=1 Tax=Streptomyces sp. NPDC038707 TaxID=3154329 RepID=UPI0033C4BCC0
MSAYKDLEALLGGTPLARKAIDAALQEHAHELAEKQRAWARKTVGGGAVGAVCLKAIDGAADLIDPEVSTDG